MDSLIKSSCAQERSIFYAASLNGGFPRRQKLGFVCAKPNPRVPAPAIFARTFAKASQNFKQPARTVLECKPQLQVDQFYLPNLQCPFQVKAHPDLEKISTEVNSWLLSWISPETEHERKLLLQSNLGGLLCWMFPFSPYSDRILAASKYIAWITNLDRMYDEAHKLNGETITSSTELLEGVLNDDGSISSEIDPPQMDAILSVTRQLRANMATPRMYTRHIEATKLSLSGVLWEAEWREKSKIPDLSSFISRRRDSVMFDHMEVMLEHCLGIELTDEILGMDCMRKLHAAAADFIGWCNDLFSFRKEYYNEDFLNLPSVVYFENNGEGGFQKAINTVCNMIRDRERDFTGLLHGILASDFAACHPELQFYLRNLPYMLSGHLEWCYETAKFHGIDHQVGKIRHGWVHMDHERTIIQRQKP